MWQKVAVKAGMFGIRWLKENWIFLILIVGFLLYMLIEETTGEGAISSSSSQSGEQMIINQSAEGINPWHIGWPTPKNYDISSPFGMRNDPFTGELDFHTGIDIPGDFGDPVQAVYEGIVIRVLEDEGDGYGNVVYLEHKIEGESVITVYAHLQDIFVKEGDQVEQGYRIGTIGSTGRSTGPHLHYEVRIGEQYIDPFKLSYLYTLFAEKLVQEGESAMEMLLTLIEESLKPNETILSYETWYGIQTIDVEPIEMTFHKRVKAWAEYEIEIEVEEEICETLEDGTEVCETSYSYELYTIEEEFYKDYFMTFGDFDAVFIE